jgi:hypothetical protein
MPDATIGLRCETNCNPAACECTTDGQVKTKSFDSATKADGEYNKLVLEKASKG